MLPPKDRIEIKCFHLSSQGMAMSFSPRETLFSHHLVSMVSCTLMAPLSFWDDSYLCTVLLPCSVHLALWISWDQQCFAMGGGALYTYECSPVSLA